MARRQVARSGRIKSSLVDLRAGYFDLWVGPTELVSHDDKSTPTHTDAKTEQNQRV